jgi:hypothetical protein
VVIEAVRWFEMCPFCPAVGHMSGIRTRKAAPGEDSFAVILACPRIVIDLPRMKRGPHHPLGEVKALVASGAFMVIKGRGLSLLVPPLSHVEALSFVAAAIQLLTLDNFHATVPLTYDVADEYGINIENTGWYISPTRASDADEGGNGEAAVMPTPGQSARRDRAP